MFEYVWSIVDNIIYINILTFLGKNERKGRYLSQNMRHFMRDINSCTVVSMGCKIRKLLRYKNGTFLIRVKPYSLHYFQGYSHVDLVLSWWYVCETENMLNNHVYDVLNAKNMVFLTRVPLDNLLRPITALCEFIQPTSGYSLNLCSGIIHGWCLTHVLTQVQHRLHNLGPITFVDNDNKMAISCRIQSRVMCFIIYYYYFYYNFFAK